MAALWEIWPLPLMHEGPALWMVGIENLTLPLCGTSIGENSAIYHIGTAAADGMLYEFFCGIYIYIYFNSGQACAIYFIVFFVYCTCDVE